ncbi:MAG: TlpA family protein disulfide reductase [Anaerolineae bacterium]|nr:TlpA family protein disulfide reductase [Anaerolineae bacterium]
MSGAFLILVGILVASGTLQGLSATLATGAFAEAAINLEEQVLDSIIGEPGADSVSDVEALSQTDSPVGFEQLAESAPSTGTAAGQIAPDFATTGDDGQALLLSDYRGQVVLLNFWATWCGPCRIEMPEFEQIYREREGDYFVVIAVNNAETAATVQDFREELALSYPLALDEDASIQALYGINNYPSTYLLDQNGIILSPHFGALTVQQIHELVDGALAA